MTRNRPWIPKKARGQHGSRSASQSANQSASQKPADESGNLAEMLGRLVSGAVDLATFRSFSKSLRRSVRINRRGLSLTGQGMADLLLRTAPLIPLRDKVTLQAHYGGMTSTALAGHLIRHASRNSAAVGGVTGAVASMGELAPPFWVMLPVEVVAETLVVAAIEMKLVAELHEVYGRPITGTDQERGAAILEAWALRKGIDMAELRGRRSASSALGQGARSQIVQIVRRKLVARAARNISSLLPLLVGAVAGAELNRRATRDIGDELAHDLQNQHP